MAKLIKMRHLVFLFLFVFSFISCNETNQGNLSASDGDINNVSIIIDDKLWNGEIGDSIRKKFAAPVDGLPQEEPLFTLNQYSSKVFEGFVRKSRNIIVIQKGQPKRFTSNKNQFAKPQKVFYVSGSTTEELLQQLELYSSTIIKSIKAAEIIENQKRISSALISDKKIRERFGVSLQLSSDYRYELITDKFLWLRREITTGYNNILIYEAPIDAIENQLSIGANIILVRDKMGKKYIHGMLPNTWMVTEAAYSPYLFKSIVGGRKTFITKGTWELKNDFMVGPFVNYAIKDAKNNRFLILEGFTYNPSKSKRDLIFELEAIMQSITFLK